jgi:hypothetical protein
MEEFCFIELVLLYPPTLSFVFARFGHVEAPLLDTQREGGIGTVLYFEEGRGCE